MTKFYLFNLKRAISNDCYLDHFFRSKIKNSESKISLNIPKYNARLNAYNQYGKFFLIVDKLLSKFWLFFSLSFLVAQCLKLIISFKKKLQANKNYEHLFFINSPVSARLASSYINQFQIDENSCVFLLYKKEFKTFLPINYFTINTLQCISFFERVKISCLSIFSFIKFNYELKLYSFHFVEWISLLKSLERINYKFFHSFDHYDRFAILADSQSELPNKNKIYYFHQHGKFPDLNESFTLPFKLNNVGHTILSDLDISYQFFLHKITTTISNLESVEILNNPIRISKLNIPFKYSILIIGNVICLKFHQNLIQRLSLYKDIFIYYKPHPNKLVYLDETKNLKNIKDFDFYPNVNLIISYKSTLLDFYVQSGYPYIEHYLDESNVTGIYEEIKLKLNMI